LNETINEYKDNISAKIESKNFDKAEVRDTAMVESENLDKDKDEDLEKIEDKNLDEV
jgi:hypothetical protein